MQAYAFIKKVSNYDYVIYTDASNEVWGASEQMNHDINGMVNIRAGSAPYKRAGITFY